MSSVPPHDRKVQPVGFYGWGNFGDELFVEVVRSRADLIWPQSQVQTFVPDSSAHYASLSPLGSAYRVLGALRGIAWADTLALCGGSTLSDVTGVNKLRGVFGNFRQLEGLGVSLGPFQTAEARKRVEHFLMRFNRLIVRDRISLSRASEMDLPSAIPQLGGDLAGLYQLPEPDFTKTNATDRITICPSAAAVSSKEALLSQISDAIESSTESLASNRLLFLSLHSHPDFGDDDICHYLASKFAQRGYHAEAQSFGELGLHDTVHIIKSSRIVWSQRLHGAIIAYLFNVPFLLVGHHEKCRAFADDIGLPPNLLVPPDQSWIAPLATLLFDSPQPSLSPANYRIRAEHTYGFSNPDCT